MNGGRSWRTKSGSAGGRRVVGGGLDDGVDDHVGEAAGVDAPDNAVVAVLAPGVGPGVLDDPVGEVAVVRRGLGAVADGEDGVVEAGRVAGEHVALAVDVGVRDGARAAVLIRRAADDAVDVEVHAVRVQRDGERSVFDEVEPHQGLVRGAEGDHLKTADVRDVARSQLLIKQRRVAGRRADGIVLGVAVDNALVGIGVPGEHAAEVREVLHSGEGIPAVAAQVHRVAVDELLRRERAQLAGREEVRALEVGGGREGPAAPAVRLVLDVRDRA
mmetsp:Transcript_6171/g.18660  ORF Transcript_6171/g.18660 Transcript_6171/m.18660 type:complete len:273 (+) Transcript_6171:178-996(+)